MVEISINHDDEATKERDKLGGKISEDDLELLDKSKREQIVKISKEIVAIGESLLEQADSATRDWRKEILERIDAVNNSIRDMRMPDGLENKMSTFFINALKRSCSNDLDTLSGKLETMIIAKKPAKDIEKAQSLITECKAAIKNEVQFAIDQSKFIINFCQN